MAKKRRTDIDPVKAITVVFDFGGVLAHAHDPIPTILRETGGDPEAVAKAYWENRGAYDAGKLTLEQYWTPVLAAAGIEDPSEDELLDIQDVDNRYFIKLAPQSRDLIHDLARNGVRLAILSNTNENFGELIRKQEWFEAFQFAIISAEEKTIKPERHIFDITLDVIAHETGGVARPSNVIFFDDLQENVDAARALGIDAHLWPRNGKQASAPSDDNATGDAQKPGWEIAREVLSKRSVPLG